ncbi:hypothetical protein SEA_GOCRAZY_53 [Arthrobacter phage GoCrazy]|uniref:Uncharacterized protein n=2 Tax=Mudcatvirus TaxID=1982088 RepID=A0A0U4JFX4_9CAUD|nr:hypothetical protein FDH65_gp56 [Arthrobacter phage Circum]YP_010666931.1 hypothetical protein PQB83_gp53 [Arthrobacter phage KeaneyLin]QXO13552.1 hypothetical protein SEA_GOCRAZY_53 [Arthrobacter phage GoCrazy]WBF79099.1 hypothetical protein SEA_HANKLY_53 [Arthrobacter phage Hankly]ALY08740.1 hypothetical protein CIRCUM_56 [Arthrobacter phage Circum]AXH44191.1 hypothetical protein SEA_KEANEYLIN_53 [Arthrobacter phage KeaneyLin]
MTEILGTRSTLGLSDSGEYKLTRHEIDSLYDQGIRSYDAMLGYLVTQNPGFEFLVIEDFTFYGVTIKWRRIK